MAREAIFSRPTKLYHPSEGWREFPAGEQNPGPAWSEHEGGPPADGKRDAATLKEMLDLTERAERAEGRISQLEADLAARSQEASDASAKVAGLEERAVAAERKAAEAEANVLRIAGERDQAQQNEQALRDQNAELQGRVRELEADLASVGASTAEERAGLKAKLDKLAAFDGDGDGDGAPGGSKPKKAVKEGEAA